MNLLDMAVELIEINQDIIRRRKKIEEFYVIDFEQVWGSTALGFGGVGGSAMTTARTYVLMTYDADHLEEQKAYVYFGGRFAYECDVNDELMEDIGNCSLASVAESGRYKK